MSTVIAKDRLLEYFEEVSLLNKKDFFEQQCSKEQIALVEKTMRHTDLTESEKQILRGENLFYQKDYKAALKHYVAAKKNQYSQLCCVRALAYSFEKEGEIKKADKYVKKGLAIEPDDALMQFLSCKFLPNKAPKEILKKCEIKAEVSSCTLSEVAQKQIIHSSLCNKEKNNVLKEIFNYQNSISLEMKSDLLEKMIWQNSRERQMETQIKEAVDALSEESAVEVNESLIDSLQELADSHYEVKTKDTDAYLSQMGIGIDTENELEKQIELYQEKRRDLLSAYRKASRSSRTPDHGLFILSGWKGNDAETRGGELLAASTRKATSGFFIRWNGKGVAVNPGVDFLLNLHEAGLHITDVDYVIVTRATSDAYADTQAIYDLNYQLNFTAAGNELHIIHYYLNQQAHRDLASQLKPNFKQERHTVHSLELYVDSPDVEKINLCSEIQLHYFSCHSTESDSKDSHSSSLGIRLDCLAKDSSGCAVSIGHVSGTSWSPLQAHNLGHCDILITGFHHTCSKDYRKVKPNDDSLGYFGCYSLMEEVAPKLMLCTEFEGKEGDIRLEVIRKMRHEYAYSNQRGTSILPGDKGFYLDLKTMQVRCSLTGETTDPSQIRVVKGKHSFGDLQYLSPSCFA